MVFVDAVNPGDAPDGSAGNPYATLQAAYDGQFTTRKIFSIRGEVGPLSGPDLNGMVLLGYGKEHSVVGSVVTEYDCSLTGNGMHMIAIGSVTATVPGAVGGSQSNDAWTAGGAGGNGAMGRAVTVRGMTILDFIEANGSHGGQGGDGTSGDFASSGGNGGAGGAGGSVTLYDCACHHIVATGGNGGSGGHGGHASSEFGVGGNSGHGGGSGGGGSFMLIRSTLNTGSHYAGTAGAAGGPGNGTAANGTAGDAGVMAAAGGYHVRHSEIAGVTGGTLGGGFFSMVGGSPV